MLLFSSMHGQRPILKTREHISSISHEHEQQLFELWQELPIAHASAGTESGYKCVADACSGEVMSLGAARKHVEKKHMKTGEQSCEACSFFDAGDMPHKKHNPAKCSERKQWYAFWEENVLETENIYQCKLPGCSETPLEKEAIMKHVAQHCEGMHLCILAITFLSCKISRQSMVDTNHANSLKHREMAYLHPKWELHVSFPNGSYVCALHAMRKLSVKSMMRHILSMGHPSQVLQTDMNVPLCEVCAYFAQIQGTTGIIPADQYHLVSSEHTRYVQTKVDWIEFAPHCEQNKSSALCALPNKCSRLMGFKSIFTAIRGMLKLGLFDFGSHKLSAIELMQYRRMMIWNV